MKRTLIITFETESMQKKDFYINNVKESLTETEVREISDAIIAENIFFTNSGDLKTAIGANVIVETTEEVF